MEVGLFLSNRYDRVIFAAELQTRFPSPFVTVFPDPREMGDPCAARSYDLRFVQSVGGRRAVKSSETQMPWDGRNTCIY